MNPDQDLQIAIQWQCSHCGHSQSQTALICTVPGEQGKTGSLAAGAMVCPKCGHLGPMQLGCAVVLGMSVMASSDGVVDFPWNPARDGNGRRIWSAQHPSRN